MNRTRPKYMPDVAKVLREHDPAAFDERHRKALRGVWEAGLIERLTPEPEPTPSSGSHEEVVPSPWANVATELDKSALPSAMVPTMGAEEPVTKAAKPESPRRKWPATWIVVLGCIGFMLAVGLLTVSVLLGRGRATSASAPGPSETAGAIAMPAASAPGTTSAMTESPAPSSAVEEAPSTPSVAPTTNGPPSTPTARKQAIKPHDTRGEPRRDPATAATPTEPPPPPPPPPPSHYFE